MRRALHTLRLLFSGRTRHYEILAPLRGGGYIIYAGSAPANHNCEED